MNANQILTDAQIASFRRDGFVVLPGFYDAAETEKIVAWVDEIAAWPEEPAVLFKDKINFKLPGSDGFKAHQDVQAGWDDYARCHISMLVSIDAANAANGYLEVAASWHDKGSIGTEWTPLSAAETAAMTFESCPSQPGDAILFDSFAPHRSAPNRTGAPRRALYITYNRASEGYHRVRYFADKRASFPPDIEREPSKTYTFRV